jgi:uncharacterized membrane-anchored protein
MNVTDLVPPRFKFIYLTHIVKLINILLTMYFLRWYEKSSDYYIDTCTGVQRAMSYHRTIVQSHSLKNEV